jgi:sulfonate transport system substrate-binding protein
VKKRAFILALLAFILAFAKEEAAIAADALRVSGWTRPFNLHVMMEIEDGAYAKAFPEFDVTIVDMQSGPNLMAALEAGEVDIVQGIGDAAFLVAASEGIDARVFAVNSRSPKAFAVVTKNPDIKNISDLKGHSAAGLRGSVVHQVFMAALAENGMTESDVDFYPMPLANAASTLLAGRVDAALLVGGDILRIEQAGGTVLADGEGRVSGLSFAVIRAPFLRDHPDVVARFIAMRQATLEAIQTDRARALEAAAKDMKQEPAEIERIMAMYDFGYAITSDDISSMEATKKYLRDNKMLRNDVDIESLFVM